MLYSLIKTKYCFIDLEKYLQILLKLSIYNILISKFVN